MKDWKGHKCGFVSIVGKPNVGKSTLMNALMGEKLAITTPKAQTTRHRIMGIINDEKYQIVYSDTPGVIVPKYELQRSMMRFVSSSLEDADLVLYVTDATEKEEDAELIGRIKKLSVTKILIINKIDAVSPEQLALKTDFWQKQEVADTLLAVSAREKFNLDNLFSLILSRMPEHPPFFDKEEITDRSERFFAGEFVREAIFQLYQEEIPYSCEVAITSFKEKADMLVIQAEIYVERQSQRGIVIGEGGKAIKKVGIRARQEMEKFFGKKVFLETLVKIAENWRSDERSLRRFGYNQE